MADKKFSELDPVGSLTGTEILPVIKEGLPKRTTVADVVANYVLKSGDTMTGQLVAPSYDVSGAKILSSTGFPEGVVTAPVGSIYIDKAITNGASTWIKKSGTGSTGWQVLEGDTGWRLVTGAFIGLDLRVRRVNGTVYHKWSGTPNITGNSTTYSYPTGFAGDAFTAWIFLQGGTPTNMRVADDGGSAIFYGLTNTTVNYPHSAVPTSTAWPSTLPGVSA